jgi:hypothetical protein
LETVFYRYFFRFERSTIEFDDDELKEGLRSLLALRLTRFQGELNEEHLLGSKETIAKAPLCPIRSTGRPISTFATQAPPFFRKLFPAYRGRMLTQMMKRRIGQGGGSIFLS